MDCVKRFSSLGRVLTLRSKTLQDIRLKEKYKQYYSLASVNFNLKQPKISEKNLIYEYQPVFNTNRCFCDVVNKNKNMINTFAPYYSSFPLLTMLSVTFKVLPFRLLFDRNFNQKTFIESAEVVLRVISKLVAEKRLSELEGLVTPECIAELRDKIDNWNPNERDNIAVTDADYLATIIYSLDPRNEGGQIMLEASVCHLVLKNLASEFDPKQYQVGELMQKMNKVMENPGQEMYAANYRYVKAKGSDQWIVNGINHFRISDMNS